jgi:cyanophycinase
MGTVVVMGGRATESYGANDVIWAEVARRADTDTALVLPTAAAFEQPAHEAARWREALTVRGWSAEAAMVLTRADANDAEMAAAVAAQQLVVVVGSSPLHQRAVLKGSAVWEALVGVAHRGVVVAVAGAGAGIGDPMTDTRGGAFTIGLGLVRLAVITEAETWSPERLHRARALAAGFPLALLASGTALVDEAGRWTVVGEGAELISPG